MLQVIKYPHPTLRHKSKPVRRVDAELRQMVREMFELMYANEGIGLAANQVDLPYRLFVMNIEADPEAKKDELVFINPVVTKRKGQAEDSEGCLSFPQIFAPVTRPAKVSLEAYSLAGEPISCDLSGLYARAVQHEIDHLDGVLFIDRLAPTALASIREDLEELEFDFDSKRRTGEIVDDAAIEMRLKDLESART